MEEQRDDDSLSLRTQGVGEEDLARLAVFLRVGSDQLMHRWRIAPDEHFDALLLGQDETLPMSLVDPVDASAHTLRLVEAARFEGEQGQLCRPLAFEPLIEQLRWVELHAQAAPPITRRPPPLASIEPAAASPKPLLPAEASSEAPPASVPRGSTLRPGDLYRLERLPAAASLGNDRRVLTLASLLTIRAVRLEELVAQSGLDAADCEAALMRLKALGVLLVIRPGAVPARGRSSSASRRADAERAKDTDAPTGVISRLRDRLGFKGR